MLFTTGNGTQLPSQIPSTVQAAFQPTDIKYYKLTFAYTSGNPSRLNFSFKSASGYLTKANNATILDSEIRTIAQNVATGTSPTSNTSLSYNQLSGQELAAPDIRTTRQCYVIVELDEAIAWNYLPSARGLMMQDNSLGYKYAMLKHLDATGTIYDDVAPASPLCNVIYFAATDCANSGSNVADLFNIYLQIQQQSGSLNIILDPEIKNDGGKPEFF